LAPQGYFTLVLHAHLPFVRHPEHPEFLEEGWFYEALTETYLPLLVAFERLASDAVGFRATVNLSPPLCEMMADPLLQGRYLGYLDRIEHLASREAAAWAEDTPIGRLARMYLAQFRDCRARFEAAGRNVLSGFRSLQDHGLLEIITCGATHGMLPLMSCEQAVRAQVEVAAANYRKHFGRSPRGIWLPECGYGPGLEEHLRRAGIRYFFCDAHAVMFGSPRPKYGVFRPIYCPGGVAALARDLESSKQVWSRQQGYPGDYQYREFYRDVGHDGEQHYVGPYLPAGIRTNLGLKYYRITGEVELHQKEYYDPAAAREKAAEHAGNFLFNRQAQARHLRGFLGVEPVVVSPYDAELFGHWWYEGPAFLEFLFRKMHYDQDEVAPITPSEFLERHPTHQRMSPTASTWGDKGYFEVWLNGSNDWIYRHLHAAEGRMVELARRYGEAQGLTARALNQAARELLLAQSSDWAFIMTTGTMSAYAERRTREHVDRFTRLYEMIRVGHVDEPWLADLEGKDSIFQEIDYRVYR
jgi:1,4-alpha-glucan branching enzyme